MKIPFWNNLHHAYFLVCLNTFSYATQFQHKPSTNTIITKLCKKNKAIFYDKFYQYLYKHL